MVADQRAADNPNAVRVNTKLLDSGRPSEQRLGPTGTNEAPQGSRLRSGSITGIRTGPPVPW
jgi:hypothetical protein